MNMITLLRKIPASSVICALPYVPREPSARTNPLISWPAMTHTYRDNHTGFNNMVEAIVTSHDMEEYRSHFDDRETGFMWQSLMFKISYRCSYCMAVCPAGEEVKPAYLENKKNISKGYSSLSETVRSEYMLRQVPRRKQRSGGIPLKKS